MREVTCKWCGRVARVKNYRADREGQETCGRPECRYVPFEHRFWSQVRKGDGCWEWTGRNRLHGYGRIKRRQVGLLAHRASWELHYGSLDPDACVLHRCDNRLCVRPDHLFIGTRTDNNADMVAKGRNSGAPGERSPNAKLRERDVREIRIRRAVSGESFAVIANDYGVTPVQVRNVVRRRAWKHVA